MLNITIDIFLFSRKKINLKNQYFQNPFPNYLNNHQFALNQQIPFNEPLGINLNQPPYKQQNNFHLMTSQVLEKLMINAEKLNKKISLQNDRISKIENKNTFLSESHNNPKNIEVIKKEEMSQNSDEQYKQTDHNLNMICNNNAKNNQWNTKGKFLVSHITFEYESANQSDIKTQLEKEINIQLRNIYSKINGLKNIKIMFEPGSSESPNNTQSIEKKDDVTINLPLVLNPINNNQTKHFSSMSISPESEDFNNQAQFNIEQSLFNVYQNCWLFESQSQKHIKMLHQTSREIFKIKNTLKWNTVFSLKKNYFKLFNLQIPLSSSLVDCLDISTKIKTHIYIFVKFFNVKLISQLFEDFMTQINLNQFASNIQPDKITDQHSNEFLKNKALNEKEISCLDLQMKDIFYEKNNESNKENILFLKKILILMNHQLRLFKDYISIKTENKNAKFYFNDNIIKRLKLIIERQELDFEQFTIQEELLSYSFSELISLIKIEDIQFFIILGNTDFLPKRNTKKIKYRNEIGILKEFELTLFEKENLLLPKIKRKDEKIKFVFKSIRKQLYNKLKKKTKKEISANKLKKMFNEKYLNNNKKAISYFYSNDISKKGLHLIENCTRLIKDMNKYKFNHFLKDHINTCIFKKTENFLECSKLTFNDFLKILFEKQSKQPWILQDILNSIPAFEMFFFNNINIRKIIDEDNC